MADIIDKAQDLNDLHLRVSLHNRRLGAKTASTEGIGICLYCSEPTDAGRWCNAECRDQWEAEQKQRG